MTGALPRAQNTPRHFKRKIDAQRWLDDIITAVTTGTYVEPSRGRVAVGEWAQTWLLTKVDLKPTTRRGYASAIRTHIDPRWASVKLIDVTMPMSRLGCRPYRTGLVGVDHPPRAPGALADRRPGDARWTARA